MELNRVYHGKNLQVMKEFPDNSIDSVVTDPPYGISFMGKKWDYDVPSVETWKEVFRVLKPGGHVLSFGGTRTYHRMVVNIEDAGFEIRDQLQWLYGSGFPKSMDVSKAIDKELGVEESRIITHYKAQGPRSMFDGGKPRPASLPASLWNGWGTALKPANEPIVLARKPFNSTVAENVLEHGTGALNIDGCRIETDPSVDDPRLGGKGEWNIKRNSDGHTVSLPPTTMGSSALGRWPANVIHDGSEEVLQAFAQFGEKTSGKPAGKKKASNNVYGQFGTGIDITGFGDSGSAARFFYCAKASQEERNAGLKHLKKRKVNDGRETPIDNAFQRGETERYNTHPTVKPIALMEYLVKLITPKGGVVLDPYCGSGPTLIAAKKLGFSYIGIDMEEEHCIISVNRIARYNHQPSLFA
jgi:DNA modification methylase